MDVAPQQTGWIMHGTGQDSAFAKLPAESPTIPTYFSFTSTGPRPLATPVQKAMTRLEAEKYREELMSERVISGEESDKAYFETVRPRLIFLD